MTHDVRMNWIQGLKDQNLELDVYLHNGIKLTGRILSFDENDVVISTKDSEHGILASRGSVASMKEHNGTPRGTKSA